MSEAPERPEGPETPGWAPPAAAYAPPSPFRRLAGLGPWIFSLLLAIAALYAISAVITLAAHGLGEYTTPAQLDRLGGADVALSLISLLQGVLEIALAVLFIIWFYRAYKNLRALRAPEPRRNSGWTIGAWFVPILQLVLPKLMLNEVWRGSEPDRALDAGPVTVPAFHHLWWATWVAGYLIGIWIGVDSGIESAFSGGAGTTTSGALSVASSVLYAVAAMLGALVVRRTTERQEARWRQVVGPPAEGAPGWTSA